MKDLYQEILDQHTAPGQMFETKEVTNELIDWIIKIL